MKSRLRLVITQALAREARIIEMPHEDEFELLISWRLGTDPKRPAKRSKVIRLVIEAEAMDAYTVCSAEERYMADAHLDAHLREALSGFDPDHHSPPGQDPPVVRWIVDTRTLMGTPG